MENTEKIFGILAYPAGHSLSPVMHGAGFKALDLPYAFEAWDVPSEGLKAFMEALKSPVEGFSVSMPHKEDIIPLLDEIDDAGQTVGAISCVYYRDGKYIGTNLDYMGVRGSLEVSEYAKNDGLERKNVIVLGGGGAAKAAVYGLKQLSMRPMIFNRTFDKAQKIGRQFNIPAYPLTELEHFSEDTEIIVNCTCLGLKDDRKIVPDEIFAKMKLSLDAVYSHTPTVFQTQAMQHRAENLTGLEWLLHQGYEAFRLWTGQEAPQEVMRQAVQNA